MTFDHITLVTRLQAKSQPHHDTAGHIILHANGMELARDTEPRSAESCGARQTSGASDLVLGALRSGWVNDVRVHHLAVEPGTTLPSSSQMYSGGRRLRARGPVRCAAEGTLSQKSEIGASAEASDEDSCHGVYQPAG